MWIELKEGCEMPDYDEYVLWRTEDGNYFVREIDKDDNDWWNGKEHPDALESYPRCTHYRRIVGPDESEEPNQDQLWEEIMEKLRWYASFDDASDTIKEWQKTYTITRK